MRNQGDKTMKITWQTFENPVNMRWKHSQDLDEFLFHGALWSNLCPHAKKNPAILWIFFPYLRRPPLQILQSGRRTGSEVRAPRALSADRSLWWRCFGFFCIIVHRVKGIKSFHPTCGFRVPNISSSFWPVWPILSERRLPYRIQKHIFPCFRVNRPRDRLDRKLPRHRAESEWVAMAAGECHSLTILGWRAPAWGSPIFSQFLEKSQFLLGRFLPPRTLEFSYFCKFCDFSKFSQFLMKSQFLLDSLLPPWTFELSNFSKF